MCWILEDVGMFLCHKNEYPKSSKYLVEIGVKGTLNQMSGDVFRGFKLNSSKGVSFWESIHTDPQRGKLFEWFGPPGQFQFEIPAEMLQGMMGGRTDGDGCWPNMAGKAGLLRGH